MIFTIKLSLECEDVKNPRPWRRNDTIKRHGLLMCQTCKRL